MSQKVQSKSGPKKPPSNTSSGASSKNRLWLAGLFIAVLAGLVLRTVHLTADPPVDLTWSLAPYTDEGAHLMNAKTKALFNQWSMDEWFFMGLSPLPSTLMFLVFKIFGFGYLPARLTSALAAAGVLILIFFLLRNASTKTAAFFGVLLTATSYLWVMQNRLATEETFLAFFLLLSLWFWVRPVPRSWHFGAAGMAVGTAILGVKMLGLFLLPVFFLEFMRQRWLVPDSPFRELGWKPLVFFLGGLLLVALVWVFAILIPFWDRVTTQLSAVTIQSGGGHPDSVSTYLKNLLRLGGADRLMPRSPFLFLCVWMGMLAWAFTLKEKLRRSSSLEFMSLAWIVGGLFFLASMNYHPLRYQTILLPGAYLFSAFVLGALWNPNPGGKPLQPGWKFMFWAGPVLLFFAFNLSYGLDPNVPPRPFEFHLGRAFIMATVLAILLAAWRILDKNHSAVSLIKKIGPAAVVVLLLSSSYLDLLRFFKWDKNRTYSLVHSARDLRRLPPGSVVAGPWSGAITMETDLRGIVMQNFCNVDRVLERFPVTHLAVLQGGWEQKYFVENYPEVLQQSRLWETYSLPRGTLYIIELPHPARQ